MTVSSHNFVKFTVIKPNCPKHSGCVFASGKNSMYPTPNCLENQNKQIDRITIKVSWVHGIFTTSKNTTAVFLAIWLYNCEFDKIMTTYCHIHSFMPNLHLTF